MAEDQITFRGVPVVWDESLDHDGEDEAQYLIPGAVAEWVKGAEIILDRPLTSMEIMTLVCRYAAELNKGAQDE